MLDKMNVLFVGVENPLHIVVSDVASERLVLIPSHGTITKDSSGSFMWRLCSYDSTHAWLVLADSISDKPFDTVYFRVKLTPEPEFVFTKNKLHDHRIRTIGWVFHHDAAENWTINLLSFEVEFYFRKQDPVAFVNMGARFNGNVSENMSKLVPNCQVLFFNFKWTCGCDPTVRRSSELIGFRIK